MSDPVEEIRGLLAQCTEAQKRQVLDFLRNDLGPHPFERRLNAPAEVILEALSRTHDLTIRGVRGILAEAAFVAEVVARLEGWRDVTPAGNHPYDALLSDGSGQVSVQVKLQRSKEHKPFVRKGCYIVEVQRTRGGKRKGQQTRPYRFGEFDILAVSMEPVAKNWTTFLYTPCRWLIPRVGEPELIEKLQPMPSGPNGDWTDSLETCVGWFRSSTQKRISAGPLLSPGRELFPR